MENVYDKVVEEKEHLMSNAILNAMAFASMLGLKQDDVSEREAYDTYGRAWIKDRTKRGVLTFQRAGSHTRSAKIYSRFEIESLKRAEKGLQQKFNEAVAISKLLSDKMKNKNK